MASAGVDETLEDAHGCQGGVFFVGVLWNAGGLEGWWMGLKLELENLMVVKGMLVVWVDG